MGQGHEPRSVRPRLILRRGLRYREIGSAAGRFYPWIDRDGLAYFRARLDQAPRDAEHALEVVTERRRSTEEQARAVAALSFKCDVLWSILDAIDRAYPE